jgi:hypothetical protein
MAHRVLKNLKINEISLCSKGAGEGCEVVIAKAWPKRDFTSALRKGRSEYDEEKSSPGFSRDEEPVDPAHSDEDAGARERRNEDR